MYVPAHFASDDDSLTRALIDAHPFATLALAGTGVPLVDHLPLMRDPDGGWPGRLLGHVARVNPLASRLDEHPRAVVVFQGVQGYISPSWYASKAEHGKVVPTWNYLVAHLECRLEPVRETGPLLEIVERLTDRFESSRERPWAVRDAPDDYVAGMLRGIVGLRAIVERVTVKAKLSQNQPAANRATLLAALEAEGHTPMAGAVRSFGGQ